MARWECIVCGLIYDEKEGWPDDGIPAGTKWSDVPDDWVCPDCGHIHESETPPDQDCPICGSPAEDYVQED